MEDISAKHLFFVVLCSFTSCLSSVNLELNKELNIANQKNRQEVRLMLKEDSLRQDIYQQWQLQAQNFSVKNDPLYQEHLISLTNVGERMEKHRRALHTQKKYLDQEAKYIKKHRRGRLSDREIREIREQVMSRQARLLRESESLKELIDLFSDAHELIITQLQNE